MSRRPRRRARPRPPGPCRQRAVRSLLVVLVDDLRVHHVVRAAGRALLGAAAGRAGGAGAGLLAARGAAGLVLLVQQGTGLLRRGGQLLVGGPDLLDVGTAERAAQLAERLADLLLGVVRQLLAALRQELLGLPLQLLGQVAGLRLVAAAPVVVGVLLRVAHHPLDVILRQRRSARDGHRLLLAGAEILRVDVHDAVGVDVERDLDLRYPARRRRETGQLVGAALPVVGGGLARTLEHPAA